MTLKQITDPRTKKTIKFGRKRSPRGAMKLHFRDFLLKSVPTPPPSVDYSVQASAILSDVFLNDQLGDCVIAGGYHIEGQATANAGDPFHATSAQITADYSAIGGYVPGDPSTDNGCNLQDAMNYWMSKGFANGTKLLGWLAIDPTNKAELMLALYLFENLYFGIELPDTWITPFPSGDGFVWDVGTPDPQNGHCVEGDGYNAQGVQIDSWGLEGTLTWAAIAQLCTTNAGGEVYVMLTPDIMAKAQTKAPSGVAWTDIIAAFDQMGGTVPVPVAPPAPVQPPAPAPSPTPAPAPVGVTLAQAQTWAVAGLLKAPHLMNRAVATSAVSQSLAKNWPKSE